MGATPQDLLRFLRRNPKGVLLRYGEAKRRVQKVGQRNPTGGKGVIYRGWIYACLPERTDEQAPQEDDEGRDGTVAEGRDSSGV